MRILVVGTGGVGGYFGAKLALAGHQVTFLARGPHGEAISKAGLRVETPAGELTARGPVIASIDEARGSGFDVALVTVKASSLAEVASGTGAALGPSGVAIPLLNGLDSEERLAEAIGRERVIGGVAQMSAGLLGPGRVYLRGGGMMTLAPLLPEQKPRVEELVKQFGEAFPCDQHDDLRTMLWQKLLWNAPFNGICAMTRLTAGRALTVPEVETLIRDAMAEVVSVANAEGVRLSANGIEALLAFTKNVLIETSPSMLQDVLAGRPTEVLELQGAIVRYGEKHGIPTPIHRMLVALLRGLEASHKEP